MCSDNDHAIEGHPSYGPIFGRDEIVIASDSTNQESWSNFGYYYKHEDYQYVTEEAKTILAGSYKFKTVEIEVFKMIN